MKTMMILMIGAAAVVAVLTGCATQSSAAAVPSKEAFGKLPDGTQIDIYTLRNSKGMEARIMTYGGVLVSLKVPDKTGALGDVVLGFDKLEGYLTPPPYFGALIGRYGNRIGGAKFTLEGKTYTLAANNGPNSLHGGLKGFDKVVWTATPLSTPNGQALQLTYVSKDGEEGFPGTLTVKAVYTLTEDNAIQLEFTATTDKPTVVNLTQHSYFNLAGKGDVLGYLVQINGTRTTPVDSTLIPTGELAPVAGTPFDFTKPMAIGMHLNDTNNTQIKYGPGYDHNWVIRDQAGALIKMATVTDPASGRVLEVWSTEPALQFYTGNFLDGTLTGKGGWKYQIHSAFCMEPQHFPDSPNKPAFPTTELKPGQTYHHLMAYKFSVQK